MSTDTPLVSIIISAYSHEKFVVQTLDSILADSYPEKELVIIDDGSKDSTPKLIEEWAKKHENELSINFTARENKGLTKTLNELIEKAEGEFILPIASDDFLTGNTIAERVEALKASTKLIMISDACVVDENGKMLSPSGIFEYYRGRKENYFTDRGLVREILFNWSLVGPVCIMKREVFDVIGGYDTELILEDWDFFFRAASINCITYYDKTVAAYRIHGESTHKNPSKIIRMKKEMIKTIHKNICRLCFTDRLRMHAKTLKIYLSIIKTGLGF